MIMLVLPLKKLRRKGRFVFGLVLVLGVVAVFHELVSSSSRSSLQTDAIQEDFMGSSASDMRGAVGCQTGSEQKMTAWRSHYRPQPWKTEYKGRANLHVFEDWCGTSVEQLRKNLHYPLYPHTRTTVTKLAVSPMWTNYGLRVFGYLHPHVDGEYVFAVSSQANSEFWLSMSASPLDCRLLAWVGRTGSEWTAPGEYEKFASQTSRPVWLSAERKYFFELIHKQGDRATDHVELAWKLNQEGLKFMVIGPKHISIYTDESLLLVSDVDHIPQTTPSHARKPNNGPGDQPDMLREDPRDDFHGRPLVSSSGLLPDCSYRPSYTIKGFPLLRYQGLQFVHMTYIYPNDYTRLTHMETWNSCFYHESAEYLHLGLSRYMRLDRPQPREDQHRLREDHGQHRDGGPVMDQMEDFRVPAADSPERRWAAASNHLALDDGDDHDVDTRKRGRNLLSRPVSGGPWQQQVLQKRRRPGGSLQPPARREPPGGPPPPPVEPVVQKRKRMRRRGGAKALVPMGVPAQSEENSSVTMAPLPDPTASHRPRDPHQDPDPPALRTTPYTDRPAHPVSTALHLHHRAEANQTDLQNVGLQPAEDPPTTSSILQRAGEVRSHMDQVYVGGGEKEPVWDLDSNEEVDPTPLVLDHEVVWSQTFEVSELDVQLQRSDWIDLHCNVSGNMLLRPSNAQAVVQEFMVKLNLRHNGRFSLVRVVNVEKRVDRGQSGRYLLELELKDGAGQRSRLSHYVYRLTRRRRQRPRKDSAHRPAPEVILCNPVGFQWNPTATVHFIVPVKNQARWVIQLISDMEDLFRSTADPHFSLILVDYSSSDMDVEKALHASALPQYEYLKLAGNFERAAGLQAGIELITDDHSIVFLCDLHISFPMTILDSIRKHSVEGHMAFAPIVMRLDCGATPQAPRGYWEVNGFGLLGVYKSDLVAAGGMNTREFTDRWGGEDWELLDRLLQAGLEVERLHLRHFFHYFHSKRGMWNRRSRPSPG